MLSVKLSDIVASLCDAYGEHGRHMNFVYDPDSKTYNGSGYLFRFDVQMSYFENDAQYHSDRVELGILVAGHRVWIKKIQYADNKLLSRDGWENTSNHDSCWRSDGLGTPLSRIYFALADQVNEKRHAAGESYLAPAAMSQQCWSPLCESIVQQVAITWQKDPADPHNYRLVLTSIEKKE